MVSNPSAMEMAVNNNKCTVSIISPADYLNIKQNSIPSNYNLINHVCMCSAVVTCQKATTIQFTVGTNSRQQSINPNTRTTVSIIHKPAAITYNTFAVLINAKNELAAGDSVIVENVNLIDLTLLFGSTIADYVYGLETASAGSGIAYLKSYGFFTNSYYAYDAGSLQSVNVSEHKFEGKNLLPLTISKIKSLNSNGTWVDNVYTYNGTEFTVESNSEGYVTEIDVQNTPSSLTAFIIANLSDYLTNDATYIVNGCPIGGSSSTYNLTQGSMGSDIGNGKEFTYSSSAADKRSIIFIGTNFNGNKIIFRPMIRYAFVEDDIFTPYHAPLSYALDSSKQLRGLFKLDSNNNIIADGDIYSSNGSTAKVTRKYKIIDLGSLTCNKHSNNTFYSTQVTDCKLIDDGSLHYATGFICPIYESYYNSVADFGTDKSIFMFANDAYGTNIYRLWICDSSKTSLTADQFKTAMNGVYLVYELATPTEESAAVFTNPQMYDKEGTEEYVDYGVAQSTRDVAIPCGHETSYVKYH